MIRARFLIDKDQCSGDFRPVKWPIQYPYWCSGQNNKEFVLVAYAGSIEELKDLWPEAFSIESKEVDKILFSDRFPKPDWYKENKSITI